MMHYCEWYDGDCVENNTEAMMDKSKTWSRSIEDLHRGGTLPAHITGNGITRAGRHSTLRYDKQSYRFRSFFVFSVRLKQCDYFEKSHISYDASAASL
ncbi:hypothetical protein GOODEAATRI_004872 [Goodea atripinnis]|uniref:Uncharacterized protein n=1 Tax=Goodea atripinnis TaxID=208336 RepID=A0ABV0PKY0_9TELE